MSRFLVPLAGGIVGMLLMLGAWHAYVDHATLHELDGYVRSIAPKINKLP